MTKTLERTADPRQGDWPDWVKREFEANQMNGCVGTTLVSESDRVRVWTIELEPGDRIGFHRHVLDYFWTAIAAGRARSHMQDGSTVETDYCAGETQHSVYGPGECKIHDLENIGRTKLIFTAVEFLDSANAPLPIPTAPRLARAA